MATGTPMKDGILHSLFPIVLLLLPLQCVIDTTFVTLPYTTTADVYSDYICPIFCLCNRIRTENVPLMSVNCTVDYFSPHVAYQLEMIPSSMTGFAFFTCSNSDLPLESSLWDGAFQRFGQLRALGFYKCRFKRIFIDGFKGLSSLTDLKIHDAVITNLDPGLLTYLPQLDTLEMSSCSLSHFFPVCTTGSLRVLNISGNHFTSLKNAGLRCSDESLSRLETLDVGNNFITKIPQWMSQSLPNLYHLNIADNYISVFDESPFTHLHKLTNLDFSNNSLTSISPNLFKGVTNLLSLVMSGNSLSEFPHSLLSNLSVLQRIDLSSMDLDDNVWMELTELRQIVHLNMSNNKLTSINAHVMSQFLRLKYCHLSHNKIESFPRTTFDYQVNLNTLDLSFNEIQVIPSGAFNKQTVLKQLYLRHNRITTIDSETFSSLRELVTLDITNNRISSLPATAVLGLNQVTHLDVSSNSLTQIDSDLFLGMLQITHLNVSHNLLANVAEVNQLRDLVTLDISYNKIASLSPSFLSALQNLITFSASNNKIKSLPFRLFHGCTKLSSIDLSNNFINQMDENLFTNNTNLKVIDLSHNNIADISTVFTFLQSLESIDLSFNNLTRFVRLQTFSTAEHINIANNNIAFIPSDTFSELVSIRTVDLSSNKLTSIDRFNVKYNLGYLPEFTIKDNPFVCDCKLGWLKDWSDGKFEGMLNLPRFVLGSSLLCNNSFHSERQSLQTLQRSEFLCPYKSHCEESCTCCESAYACQCRYTCPSACQCFIGGDNLHVHRVQCNSANLTTIPDGLPEGTTDLRLDGNNIQSLHKHGFLALKRVENLYLNGSQIDSIENNTFKGLKSVKRLYLHDNHLTAIYSVTFLGLEILEELYLNNNNIYSIDMQAFVGYPTLSVVNIQGNELTTISINDLSVIANRTLDNGGRPKLFLSGNPWSCDAEFACNLLSFVQKSSEVIVDVSNIYCIPAEVADTKFHSPGNSSVLLADLSSELCSNNQTTPETARAVTSPSIETGVLIFICVTVVFTISLLVAAYANRHLLQVLCFTKFGLRMFKMAKTTDDNERPYDAFISYSNKDEDFVIQELVARLENEDTKFNLCVHYRDFPVGAFIAETIVRSVEASKRTILVVSDNFLDSEWCRFEFQTAHQQVLNERRNRVILILLHDLDSDKLDSTLKVYMRTRTYLKYDDPWFWEKLMFAMPDV